jgi:ABC-type Fe3+/spermidine/putrescine transport system ATPase subunit
VIGRSGAGKSTFVKLLLGFEEGEISDTGHLELGGINMKVAESAESCRSIDDVVGYVAQRPVLLPHWSVEKNLLFGIRQQLKYASACGKKNKTGLFQFYEEYIAWLLCTDNVSDWKWLKDRPEQDLAFNSPLGLLVRFMGISDKMKNHPAELSGGEAQRVHLLRWLILGRPILVLDEAFSALDQPLKGMVRDAIHRHSKAFGTSVVNISHDRADVLQVSDRVFFVEEHKILEDASPRQLFFAPRTRDLAIFLGHTNLFRVEACSDDPRAVVVKYDEYRDVRLSFPERIRFEQNVVSVGHPGYSNKDSVVKHQDTASVSGQSRILFIPSADVNIDSIENGNEAQDDRSFRVESMRFTGTHYDMRLVRGADCSSPLRIDAVVQDDDLMSRLPPGLCDVEGLVGKMVTVSFVRGIMLPGEGS